MIGALLKLIKASLCMYLSLTASGVFIVLLGVPALLYYMLAIKMFISESLSDTINNEYDVEDLKIIFYAILAISGFVFSMAFLAVIAITLLVAKIYILSISRYINAIKVLQKTTNNVDDNVSL